MLRAPWMTPGLLAVEEWARDMWSQYMWWGVASDKILISDVGNSRAPMYGLCLSPEMTLHCFLTF